MPTELEDALYWQIVDAMLPLPEREKEFIKGRKFRADFLWRKERVIAEVNGGTFRRMAHSTPRVSSKPVSRASVSRSAV